MRRIRLLLRGLAKAIVAIVAIVVAGVIGVGLGVGLSALVGDDNGGALPDNTRCARPVIRTSTSNTKPARATRTKTTGSPRPAAAPGVCVQILYAFLQRGVSASGRRRKRARISVHVRVTNRGTRRIVNTDPVLIAKARVRPDPDSRGTTGTLLKSVPPGTTAGGRLRFETVGTVTQGLESTLRARLSIARQIVPIRLRLGEPPG